MNSYALVAVCKKYMEWEVYVWGVSYDKNKCQDALLLWRVACLSGGWKNVFALSLFRSALSTFDT